MKCIVEHIREETLSQLICTVKVKKTKLMTGKYGMMLKQKKNNKTKQNYTYGFPELEITFRGRPH
jgi:hypothetical protein